MVTARDPELGARGYASDVRHLVSKPCFKVEHAQSSQTHTANESMWVQEGDSRSQQTSRRGNGTRVRREQRSGDHRARTADAAERSAQPADPDVIAEVSDIHRRATPACSRRYSSSAVVLRCEQRRNAESLQMRCLLLLGPPYSLRQTVRDLQREDEAEEEVAESLEAEEEGREHVDAVLQEYKMLDRRSVSRC